MPITSADPNSYIAFGMQSALGSPQNTLAKLRFAKYLSGNAFNPDLDVVDLREGGDGLDWGYSYKRLQKAGGQLVANLRPELAGQFFQLLPGGATWAGASAPAIHTFHGGHASHPWATLHVAHPATSMVHLVSDVRFTGYTLEYASGEPLKLTAPYTAITHGASDSPLTPTYISEEPFLYYHTPSIILDGVADTDITGIKLDVALGVEELQSQGIGLDEVVVQNRDGNVEVVRRYEDAVLWKKINMGAAVSATTSVATGSLDVWHLYGAAGAAQRAIRTYIPLVSWRSNVLSELDPDGKTIMETISGKALKGATHAIIHAVHNGHASAYIS